MNIEMPQKTKTFHLNRVYLGLIVMLITIGFTSLAQETDTIVSIQKDPEKILRKLDIKTVTRNGFNFWQDKFSGHWAGFDFGFNTFLNKDYSVYETEFMKNDILRSNSLYLNIIQQSIGLQHNRNTIGLVTGLGIQFQGYRLDKNTTIERLKNDKIVPKILDFEENQRSNLSIYSISIPILAEFQIPINHYENRIYISGGLYLGYRIHSHTKIKYRERQTEFLRVNDHYSLHNFKYGAMLRTGYRWINFFAIYEITPLFKEGKGPELTPFTFGITLLRF